MHMTRFAVFVAALVVTSADGRIAVQQEPPLHDLVEDLRILSNESSAATALTPIGGLTVLSDGSIVTVQGRQG